MPSGFGKSAGIVDGTDHSAAAFCNAVGRFM
jgi:hypothetical protein